ncbi:MAG: hypothetical protein C5B51_20775 [Terriglobia bacterium]|nr:MAG: hypothetical protein C5B51_20775 [Terriglobia bacterium]
MLFGRLKVVSACLLAFGAVASIEAAQPTISQPAKFAISPPMSTVPQAGPGFSNAVLPVHPIPKAASVSGPDGALQKVSGPLVAATPGIQFDGVDDTICNCAPGDPNMAAGPNHLVQVVNTGWAVYNKAGVIAPGFPKTLGSIWTALGAPCNGQWGDPIVQYDRLADRWFLSQLGSFSAPFFECMAVSTTNDPTGSYALYSYNFGSNLPDYPKIGVWPTAQNPAYLAMYHMFQNGQTFLGTNQCAYDRTAMLAGSPTATQICFLVSGDGGFLPSDLDGPTPPPAGSPGYFLNFFDTANLHMFKLTPNFAVPANSTFVGPINIPVTAFTGSCGGFGGSCVPQTGTSTKLDSLGDRMMYRLAYTNFGTYESMVVNHDVGSGGVVGVRWYEMRDPNGTHTIFQQGTFQPDATYRWMGSIAQDKKGDIAVGYSSSSSSLHPGIRYTGRVPTDPLGTLQSEAIMFTGNGSQTGNLTRWGDYTSLRLDPADDCTFWYTNQYIPSNGSFNWHTRIGSFSMNNCTGGGGGGDFTIDAQPPSQTVVRGGTATYTVTVAPLNGFTGTVSLSLTGAPSRSTVAFNPSQITGGSGTSTLTVTLSSRTRPNTYHMTVTGTSGGLTHSVGIDIVATRTPTDTAPDDPDQ